MPTPAPPNNIGLTATGVWDCGCTAPPLTDQLRTAGVPYRTRELPTIAGMGGTARLVFYTSPRRDRAVTVLAVPHQADVDQFGESYYYFEGIDEDDATAGDVEGRWASIYDMCCSLASERPWTTVSTPVRASDVAVGVTVIEALNGVRHRVTGIVDGLVHLVPIDNPMPVPRRNAPGRHPITVAVNNLCGTYRLLSDSDLAALDSATYAERLGVATPGIQWLPHQGRQ